MHKPGFPNNHSGANDFEDEDEKPVVVEEAKWRVASWFPNLPEETVSKLKNYQEILIKFNKTLNLISPKTRVNSDLIHFSDSLKAGSLILEDNKFSKIHDIGSGNGFPGMVMAIVDPSREFVLVDSDVRKMEFLKHVASKLSLKNVSVITNRVEDLAAETIFCAVSRAFAPIPKAILSANKAFVSGGDYFHLKTDTWSSEVSAIPVAVSKVWSFGLHGEYALPITNTQLFVVKTTKK